MSYAKLDSGILHSSVWASDLATRVLWVTILALKDEFGFVPASKSGLQRAANVTIEEFEKALLVLESPDPDSRTPDYDGRRVSKCDGGWIVLNHDKYRLREDIKREEHRLYVQNDRKKKKESSKNITVNECDFTKDHNESPSVSVSVSEFEGDARGNFIEGNVCENTWRDSFDVYLKIVKEAHSVLIADTNEIIKQKKFYPDVDVVLSIEKAVSNFWGTEAGWKHKKKSRAKEIDMRATLINAIGLNKVYYPRGFQKKELMIEPDYHQKAPKREITIKQPIPEDMFDSDGHLIIKQLSEQELAEREAARVEHANNYMAKLKKAIHEKGKLSGRKY
jgi:hypothetical protein